MSDFEEVEQSVVDMMDKIIDEDFPTILNARIKILYYMKKKSSKGSLILGQMVKSTPILKHFTGTGNNDGYNYIMYLDGNVFPALEIEDQKRIIRHELNHILIDLDAKDPFKVTGHEIEDFYKEIKYNKEDPEWKERCFVIAESIYSKDD